MPRALGGWPRLRVVGVELVVVASIGVDALVDQTPGWNRLFVLTVAMVVAVALRRVHPGLAPRARDRRPGRVQNEELRGSRARERREAAAAAAAGTRTAREMHDVVSRQISLLAVQAGALRVSSSTPEVAASAEALRSLAVRANDELRWVLKVLRAGTDGEPPSGLAPPTLPDRPGGADRHGQARDRPRADLPEWSGG